jgi:hypothetical protein
MSARLDAKYSLCTLCNKDIPTGRSIANYQLLASQGFRNDFSLCEERRKVGD